MNKYTFIKVRVSHGIARGGTLSGEEAENAEAEKIKYGRHACLGTL